MSDVCSVATDADTKDKEEGKRSCFSRGDHQTLKIHYPITTRAGGQEELQPVNPNSQ